MASTPATAMRPSSTHSPRPSPSRLCSPKPSPVWPVCSPRSSSIVGRHGPCAWPCSRCVSCPLSPHDRPIPQPNRGDATMLVHSLSHSARRFLMNRLERLHDALLNLGRRLRESIAEILGTHVGAAVRDAVENPLLQKWPALSHRSHLRYEPLRDEPRYSPREDYDRTDFWEEPPEPSYLEEESEREQEAPKQGHEKATRWKVLLTGVAQL